MRQTVRAAKLRPIGFAIHKQLENFTQNDTF